MKKLFVILGMVALIGFCFTPAWAEELNEDEGGLNNQVTWLNPWDFESILDFGIFVDVNQYGFYRWIERFSLVFPGWWAAPIHLPDGARLVRAELYCYDSSAPFNMEFSVIRNRMNGIPLREEMIIGGAPVTTQGNGGYQVINAPVQKNIVNTNNLYYALINLNTAAGFEGVNLGDHRHRFSGVKLTWRRQVSDAPAAHTFWDVPPGSFGYQFIEALAASGITEGCDPHNYCPDDYVTRAQMAIFLARLAGL